MKIPREAMTPALDAALKTLVDSRVWHLPLPAEDGPARPDRVRQLLTAYSSLKGLDGVCWFMGVFGLLFALLGRMIVVQEWERAWRNGDPGDPVPTVAAWPTVLAVTAVAFLIGGVFVARWRATRRPDGPRPTADFLAAALPWLDLAPVQRRYAETLAAVYSGRAGDPGDGLGLLRRLTEEEERLTALARTVEGAPAEEVAGEADRIRARLQTARDPAAREALAQSLALAERRLPGAERAAALRERLDAHASLLDQASRTAAETILGRHAPGPGLDGLRANVARLSGESLALESAIAEMRAL